MKFSYTGTGHLCIVWLHLLFSHHCLVCRSRRTMAATGANTVSSRSHAIFQITLESKSRVRDVREQVHVAKLSLIDLAGSERAAASDNRGIRMVEVL